MNSSPIYFLYPGDLDTASGGYRYDRTLIEGLRELSLEVETQSLPSALPELTEQAEQEIAERLAAIPDRAIVVIDGLVFGLLDRLAEKEAQRLRLVALCHHPLGLETGLAEAERQRLLASESRALRHARLVLVTSEHTKQILVDQLDVDAANIVAALPGTEPAEFAPGDGDPPCLLCVASLTRRKGHDLLIDALQQNAKLPWHARFVGSESFDPAWAAELHERVEATGLGSRIEFTGEVDDTRTYFQSADIFILASRYEGYGMVYAEALAAGLPIIGTSAGAIPSVVPASAGILVSPDDSEELATALERVLTDPSLRSELQVGAQQAAASLPSWPETVALVAKSLNQVSHA